MPHISMFDFYVPYAPGMHLASMDNVLWASKLGNKELGIILQYKFKVKYMQIRATRSNVSQKNVSYIKTKRKIPYEKEDMSRLNTAYAMVNFWYEQVSMRMDQCEHVISNRTIMNTLNETLYDLVLADPSVMCGELIATKLKIPFVYNVRIFG